MDSRLLDISEVITFCLDKVQEVMWPSKGSELGLEYRFYCQNQHNSTLSCCSFFSFLQFFHVFPFPLFLLLSQPIIPCPGLFSLLLLKSPLSMLYSWILRDFIGSTQPPGTSFTFPVWNIRLRESRQKVTVVFQLISI